MECEINDRECTGTLRRRKMNSVYVLETKSKREKLKGIEDRYKMWFTVEEWS